MKLRSSDDCGFSTAMSVIGGKWKTSLLWEIQLHPRRFGELRRLVAGISDKILNEQLRELEADGVVERRSYNEAPPRVEYVVTDFGRTLNEAVSAMSAWGKKFEQRRDSTQRERQMIRV